MIIKEFAIPLDKDELTRTYFGQYGPRDPVPLQMLNREINGKIWKFTCSFFVALQSMYYNI